MTPQIVFALAGAAIVVWIILAIIEAMADDDWPDPVEDPYDYGHAEPVVPRPQPRISDYRAPELRPAPAPPPEHRPTAVKLETVMDMRAIELITQADTIATNYSDLRRRVEAHTRDIDRLEGILTTASTPALQVAA